MNNTVIPISAVCKILDGDGVAHVNLNVMVGVSDDYMHLTVYDAGGQTIASQSMMIPGREIVETAQETDAEVLRRIAYDLDGPDWSECDE